MPASRKEKSSLQLMGSLTEVFPRSKTPPDLQMVGAKHITEDLTQTNSRPRLSNSLTNLNAQSMSNMNIGNNASSPISNSPFAANSPSPQSVPMTPADFRLSTPDLFSGHPSSVVPLPATVAPPSDFSFILPGFATMTNNQTARRVAPQSAPQSPVVSRSHVALHRRDSDEVPSSPFSAQFTDPPLTETIHGRMNNGFHTIAQPPTISNMRQHEAVDHNQMDEDSQDYLDPPINFSNPVKFKTLTKFQPRRTKPQASHSMINLNEDEETEMQFTRSQPDLFIISTGSVNSGSSESLSSLGSNLALTSLSANSEPDITFPSSTPITMMSNNSRTGRPRRRVLSDPPRNQQIQDVFFGSPQTPNHRTFVTAGRRNSSGDVRDIQMPATRLVRRQSNPDMRHDMTNPNFLADQMQQLRQFFSNRPDSKQ